MVCETTRIATLSQTCCMFHPDHPGRSQSRLSTTATFSRVCRSCSRHRLFRYFFKWHGQRLSPNQLRFWFKLPAPVYQGSLDCLTNSRRLSWQRLVGGAGLRLPKTRGSNTSAVFDAFEPHGVSGYPPGRLSRRQPCCGLAYGTTCLSTHA